MRPPALSRSRGRRGCDRAAAAGGLAAASWGLGRSSETEAGWQPETGGDFAELLRLNAFALGQSLADGGKDEVFEHGRVVGINRGGGDFDRDNLAGAGGAHGDRAAAGRALDLTAGELLLDGGHPGLHFLRLAHHFLDVHGGEGGVEGAGAQADLAGWPGRVAGKILLPQQGIFAIKRPCLTCR